MLHCVVEFNMQIPGVAVAVIALMALLAAQWRFATERYWSNPGLVGKILLTGIAAVVIGYLSMQGLRSGKEQYWLDRADMRVDTPERIITYAAKAQEIEPMDWETDEQVAEYLWSLSLEDSPNSLERVKQAEAWYARAAQLNPFDGYAPLGCGMCLDRLDKTQEATTYFEAALRNDPHNCYVSLELGRHCIELGELEAAKRWLLFGACKVAATEVAIAEYQKLERHMNDPLYMASAALNRDEKARDLERNKADPLLQGPR